LLVQFDPVGKNKFDTNSCDIAKAYLAKTGISYSQCRCPGRHGRAPSKSATR
jgi:hypothetical protein